MFDMVVRDRGTVFASMRTAVLLLVMLGAGWSPAPASVVTPQKPTLPPPQLSLAEKVAIQSQEKAKQNANLEFQQAEQTEQQIEADFRAAHPGWHINPQQNFSIERDQPTPPPVAPRPNATKRK